MWGRCERDALRTDTISDNPGTHRMTGQPTLTSCTGARGQRWNCLASSAALAMGKSQGDRLTGHSPQLRGKPREAPELSLDRSSPRRRTDIGADQVKQPQLMT